jgi:hypothetical protein
MSALSRFIGIIHEYQTDSSSKQPVPESVIKKMLKDSKKGVLRLDTGRSISESIIHHFYAKQSQFIRYAYCVMRIAKGI